MKNGDIEFYFINKTPRIDGTESKIDFNIFYEILKWFTDDLKHHNISLELIEKAILKAEILAAYDAPFPS